MDEKQFFVYIVTHEKFPVLYIGVTNNLIRRVIEHRERKVEGFTSKYHLTKLIYFEVAGDAYSAITREKQLKGWLRKKKIDLINSVNPEWKDLTDSLYP
ncbi:MAG: GIY-YIG nuclease family protein [bacterium]